MSPERYPYNVGTWLDIGSLSDVDDRAGYVTIERDEYDRLVDDSTKLAELEDAMIDFLARVMNVTTGLRKLTHGQATQD